MSDRFKKHSIKILFFLSFVFLVLSMRVGKINAEKSCTTPYSKMKKSVPTLSLFCNQNNPHLSLESDSLPTGGLFVSCIKDNLNSCLNILNSVATNNPEVTINVLFSSDLIGERGFIEFKKKVKNSYESTLFNFFEYQDKDTIPKYLRDIGVQASSKNKSFHLSFPYIENKKFINSSITNAFEHCGINTIDVEKMSGEKNKMTENVFENLNKNSTNSLMGGNFLSYADDGIAIGFVPEEESISGPILNLAKQLSIDFLPIPNLEVGHIDEVFKVIQLNPGHFVILSASPSEMLNFIQTQKEDWIISETAVADNFDQIDWRYLSIENKINNITEKFYSKKIDYSKYVSHVIPLLIDRAKLQGLHNKTKRDLLTSDKLISFWKKSQKTIDDSYSILSRKIADKVKNARIERINLPVLWNVSGQALIANPVNSLLINGNLYYSSPIAELLLEEIEISDDGSSPRLKRAFHRYRKYEQLIKKKLKGVGFKKVIPVDTLDYDFGQGNIHCATYTVTPNCT